MGLGKQDPGSSSKSGVAIARMLEAVVRAGRPETARGGARLARRLESSLARLAEGIEKHVSAHGYLRFQVTAGGLLFEGAPVRPGGRRQVAAALLHAGDVAELFFKQGVQRGEIELLVGVLQRAPLGIDAAGVKIPLGFWEGATENHEICAELLEDLERRGLKLSKRILWVTDGGGGIIKALRDRYGRKLIHQRCTIHKDRNIQRHLPKRYRKEAHRRFQTALEQNSYKDAKKMLKDFELWLREINESAADSLLEAFEEILTLHRLKVPALLRKTLHSTNPIESMFSMVRDCEGNIKRYRTSKMRQRWLGAVLLHCERRFKRVKGYASIKAIVAAIDASHQEKDEDAKAA